MKDFKGTPGPWVVDANGVQARWNIDDVNGNSVALTHQLPSDKDWQKRDSNTHLIAAAPELLEALTYGQTLNLPDMLDWVADRLVNVHGENGNLDFILSLRERAHIARAAIAKALGNR